MNPYLEKIEDPTYYLAQKVGMQVLGSTLQAPDSTHMLERMLGKGGSFSWLIPT